MVDLIIKNGIVVTMDSQRRILENGSIAIDDGRIVDLGKAHHIQDQYKADNIIDAKGKIIIPGLVCSHTHLYGILLRGAPLNIDAPTDFIQILQRVWWPEDEAMDRDDAYGSALAASYEMLLGGTTFFADTYSGPKSIDGVLDEIARGARETGIKGRIAFESTERHNVEEGRQGLRENRRFIQKVSDDPTKKVKGMYSIHASFTVSDNHIQEVMESAKQYPAPITIHVSEGLVDLVHNMEKYGKRSVERLRDIGLVGPNVIYAHCVHLNRDEVEIVRETKTGVVHNPMSNMLNAVGVAPVDEMLRQGVTIGLGNDGFIFDGLENIRAAFLLHKVHHRDPRVVTPLQVLEMATINGAQLYGLEGEIGSIEKGKQADITILNPYPAPTPLNMESVIGHIVYGLTGRNIDKVLVDGEIVVEDQNVTTVSKDKVHNTLQKSSPRLWQRLGIKLP